MFPTSTYKTAKLDILSSVAERPLALQCERVWGVLNDANHSWFYGIAIRMYFLDHPPPHFQAVYGEHEANVEIATGEVIEGHLPLTAARLVKQWGLAHQAELREIGRAHV